MLITFIHKSRGFIIRIFPSFISSSICFRKNSKVGAPGILLKIPEKKRSGSRCISFKTNRGRSGFLINSSRCVSSYRSNFSITLPSTEKMLYILGMNSENASLKTNSNKLSLSGIKKPASFLKRLVKYVEFN